MKSHSMMVRFAAMGILIVTASIVSAQGTVTTTGTGTAGVHIESSSTTPDVVVKTGNAASSVFRVFNSANTELLRVGANGNVGIGVTDPASPLEVNGTVRIRPASGSFAIGDIPSTTGYPFFAKNTAPSVAAAIQLHSNFAYESTTFAGNFGKYGTFLSHNRNTINGNLTDGAATDGSRAVHLILGSDMAPRQWVMALANFPGNVETMRFVVAYNGFVGIGTTTPSQMLDVQGNIHVAGNINAKYQDVAEWVASNKDLAPGTVVVLDPSIGNGVMASGSPYDTAVAGVVSAQPGISLGEAGEAKEQIATTGRVRVRVDATPAPIRVGDLLVTGHKPGVAMKSEAMEINGRKFHQPGTILGKALEAIDSGEGEILVLLSLQ